MSDENEGPSESGEEVSNPRIVRGTTRYHLSFPHHLGVITLPSHQDIQLQTSPTVDFWPTSLMTSHDYPDLMVKEYQVGNSLEWSKSKGSPIPIWKLCDRWLYERTLGQPTGICLENQPIKLWLHNAGKSEITFQLLIVGDA